MGSRISTFSDYSPDSFGAINVRNVDKSQKLQMIAYRTYIRRYTSLERWKFGMEWSGVLQK